jgi:hypothetical protein
MRGRALIAALEQHSMARKVRIAAIGTLAVLAALLGILGGAYYAARQVRPFYIQALASEPAVLEQGSRELESRATALYSDVQQAGRWQAVFTTDQINGWLATQLTANSKDGLPENVREPRVAIARDVLTLGFRTSSGGVETVISVDAAARVTEQGAVAIQLIAVRAGNLPLPVLQLADELADACQKLRLPIRWTRQDGKPVALVEIRAKEPVSVDAIQLDEGQLYVAGHTESKSGVGTAMDSKRNATTGDVDVTSNYELRLTPKSEEAGLEIARRPTAED